MNDPLLRTNEELILIYDRNVNTIYRICYVYMQNRFDAENMVQDTFIKLMENKDRFENSEHEKAWLIKTAINLCKNSLKHWWRKVENIEFVNENANGMAYEQKIENDDTLKLILGLPAKYKTALYLYYYEEYSTSEVAEILKLNESTIRGHLRRGRMMLKVEIEKEAQAHE